MKRIKYILTTTRNKSWSFNSLKGALYNENVKFLSHLKSMDLEEVDREVEYLDDNLIGINIIHKCQDKSNVEVILESTIKAENLNLEESEMK